MANEREEKSYSCMSLLEMNIVGRAHIFHSNFPLKLLFVPNIYQSPTPDMLYMTLKRSEVTGLSYEKQSELSKRERLQLQLLQRRPPTLGASLRVIRFLPNMGIH